MRASRCCNKEPSITSEAWRRRDELGYHHLTAWTAANVYILSLRSLVPVLHREEDRVLPARTPAGPKTPSIGAGGSIPPLTHCRHTNTVMLGGMCSFVLARLSATGQSRDRSDPGYRCWLCAVADLTTAEHADGVGDRVVAEEPSQRRDVGVRADHPGHVPRIQLTGGPPGALQHVRLESHPRRHRQLS